MHPPCASHNVGSICFPYIEHGSTEPLIVQEKIWICVWGWEAEKRPKTADRIYSRRIQRGGIAGIGIFVRFTQSKATRQIQIYAGNIGK